MLANHAAGARAPVPPLCLRCDVPERLRTLSRSYFMDQNLKIKKKNAGKRDQQLSCVVPTCEGAVQGSVRGSVRADGRCSPSGLSPCDSAAPAASGAFNRGAATPSRTVGAFHILFLLFFKYMK